MEGKPEQGKREGKKAPNGRRKKKKIQKNTEWELCAALALVESLEKRQIGKPRVKRNPGTNRADNGKEITSG